MPPGEGASEKRMRMLPRRLAVLLQDEALPPWVAQCCGLPIGSTVEALGSTAPPTDFAARSAVDFFAAELLRRNKKRIQPLRLLAEGSRLPQNVSSVGKWPSRVLRMWSSNGKWRREGAIENMTYGDMFSMRGVGAKSILETALTLEDLALEMETAESTIRVRNYASEDTVETARASLEKLKHEEWADGIYGTDPRWRDLVPEGGESLATVAEYLFQQLSAPDSSQFQSAMIFAGQFNYLSSATDIAAWCVAVEERYAQLAELPLETALSGLLERCTALNGDRKDALLARLGWTGNPPTTLEVAGQMLGITRERLRQIESKVREKLPTSPVFISSLNQALECLAKAAPVSLSDAATLLQTRGISSHPFSAESVIAAARDLGVGCPIAIAEAKGVAMVTRVESSSHIARILILARKKSGSVGVVNSIEIAAQVTRESKTTCPPEEVESVLRASPLFRALDDRWFWAIDLPAGRNRVVNLCRKMLSVTSPIGVRRLREGIRREFAFRNSASSGRLDLRAPPAAVLHKFLADHPDFEVGEQGVKARELLNYRTELGESDQVIVEVLRSSPAMVLDRASLLSGCIERGINQNTASIDLTYSCVVEHLDTNIWTLRGADVNPAAVEALRSANALRPKERRVRDFGWTLDGKLWIAAVVPPVVQSFVFGCPSGTGPYLRGQKFRARTVDGLPCGNVMATDEGTVYGLGPFVDMSGADQGDILIIEFDLVEQAATLLLGDDELLDAYGSD